MKKAFNWLKAVIGLFNGHNCNIHAAGLTYFSILAVIPVICCILVVAKMCGVDDYARERINEQLDATISSFESQGDVIAAETVTEESAQEAKKIIAAEEFARKAREVANGLFERINRFDIRTFGWIGFGMLLWTVISSLGMVEISFNEVWGVDRQRPIWKRAYSYTFVMVILPILLVLTMSLPIMSALKSAITATLGSVWFTRWAGNGIIWLIDSSVFRFTISLTLLSIAFAFFYWVMPNCRVRAKPALIGGVFAALLLIGWVRFCAIAQIGIARASLLYGSLAVLPIIFTWHYVSWQIVLLGACVVRQIERPVGK